MAEIALFHHVLGRTDGVRALGRRLEDGGHTVQVPDLFDGRLFHTVEDGMAHLEALGTEQLVQRARDAVADRPEAMTYVGVSMGVVPAAALAMSRPGARGAVMLEGFVAPEDLGGAWPDGVPVQVHGRAEDDLFAEDLEAAERFVGDHDAELFLYPGREHLFVDYGLPAHDPRATDRVVERVLRFVADGA